MDNVKKFWLVIKVSGGGNQKRKGDLGPKCKKKKEGVKIEKRKKKESQGRRRRWTVIALFWNFEFFIEPSFSKNICTILKRRLRGSQGYLIFRIGEGLMEIS